ncbi:MAG: transcription termination factor Rho [Opitutae bacterium]|nr:transcription termination factor Rho [Opitutae bacterium]
MPRFELRECEPGAVLDFNEIYKKPLADVVALAGEFGIPVFRNPQRRPLIRKIINAAFDAARPITLAGTLEILANGNGLLLYPEDSFSVRELSAYVPAILIKKYGLQRGHELSAIVHPPMPGETAPIVVAVTSIMGTPPDEIKNLTPFTELTPYYPTERIMLETTPDFPNNLSMRCVDLLCPIGLGQRGLIVAPPRVGKTVLLQTIANSILKNKPKVKLIVLLVDERPEEVTDFKRNTIGAEVISSTFDETPENHVHVAEMVIERARRMVELGKDVVILLDSITRLARAYNTLMPNGGKILSGGVEAGALAKPKRFFGSARNIEDGGSLTILGTALIDTGSKMDEVIFEEFKGTGNMELDLDRDLANKRIFPAINFERSGTRKEELLYHPDEMQYVYSMRRAMKGVPSLEAMEMLINRMKKTKTNIEFLMTLANRG